jgi:hypothetical protein
MSKSNRSESGAAAPATNQNIVLAMARQRLGDAHFQHALELIRRGQGEVAAPGAITIYARLHYLDEVDMQALRNRVLVYLGQVANTDVTHLPNTFVAIDGGVEWDITASLVKRIRKRLSGRRNHDFREFVELHNGFVEARLQRIHVDNLLSLREAMEPDTKLADMTRLYMRELGLRDGLFDSLYHGLLERLYESAADELEASDMAETATGDASNGSGRRGGSASVA